MDKDLIRARALCHHLLPVTLGAVVEEAPHDGDDVTHSDPEGETAKIGLVWARTYLSIFLPPIKTPVTRSKMFHQLANHTGPQLSQQEHQLKTSTWAKPCLITEDAD